MREKIMPPLVLTLICVIISGLLVLANAATKDKIAQAQQDKLNSSLETLFGEGQYTPLEDLHYEGITQVIRSAKNEVIFEITVDGTEKSDQPAGVILSQDPKDGSSRKSDLVIHVVVSAGSEDGVMLDVTGLEVRNAQYVILKDLIKEYGLTVE